MFNPRELSPYFVGRPVDGIHVVEFKHSTGKTINRTWGFKSIKSAERKADELNAAFLNGYVLGQAKKR